MKTSEDIKKAKMRRRPRKRRWKNFSSSEKIPHASRNRLSSELSDWMVAVPWSKRTKDNLQRDHVRKILMRDHFGLEKPKERDLGAPRPFLTSSAK